MTATGTTHISDLLLIIGCFENKDDPTFDPATLRNIGDNARFEIDPQTLWSDTSAWKGENLPNQRLHGPFFCLPLTHPPNDPYGWVFGSSHHGDACDFRLSKDNKTGISRRSFSVDLVWPEGEIAPAPRLRLDAGKPVMCPRTGKSEVLELKGSTWTIFEPTLIQYNQLSFRVWMPTLKRGESILFLENVWDYLMKTTLHLLREKPPTSDQHPTPPPPPTSVPHGRYSWSYLPQS